MAKQQQYVETAADEYEQEGYEYEEEQDEAEYAPVPEKKRKRTSSEKKSPLPGIIMTALVTGVLIFVAMLYIEKKALEGNETVPVYVAKEAISKGVRIDEGNFAAYFDVKQVDPSLEPEGKLTGIEDINEMYAMIDIPKGSIVSATQFATSNAVMEKLDTPVLIGFTVEDAGKSVNGILRGGDYADFYLEVPYVVEGEVKVPNDDVKEKEKTVKYKYEGSIVRLAWENVFIQNSFDLDYAEAGADNRELHSARFNIYLPKSEVEAFLNAISTGKVTITKRLEDEPGQQAMVMSEEDLKEALETIRRQQIEEQRRKALEDAGGDLPDTYDAAGDMITDLDAGSGSVPEDRSDDAHFEGSDETPNAEGEETVEIVN